MFTYVSGINAELHARALTWVCYRYLVKVYCVMRPKDVNLNIFCKSIVKYLCGHVQDITLSLGYFSHTKNCIIYLYYFCLPI